VPAVAAIPGPRVLNCLFGVNCLLGILGLGRVNGMFEGVVEYIYLEQNTDCGGD
jgi:hypothetical protein